MMIAPTVEFTASKTIWIAPDKAISSKWFVSDETTLFKVALRNDFLIFSTGVACILKI
jgi:hypothetical protein